MRCVQPQIQPANSGPLCLTPTLTLEKTTQWRREKEQCPRDSDLWLPSLPLHIQRPHLNPRMMCQTANQFQFVRAPFGLAQPRCQGTCLKIGTGCSCQNYLSNDNENKTENEPKNTPSITSPRPPVKEEGLRANDQEKCSWGPDCPFCKSQKKEEENKPQQQKTSLKIQKPQAKRPDTLNLNMTKAKQQWEAEMERLNSKHNLDWFFRFGVRLRIR